MASLLHRLFGTRGARPLVTMNAGGLSEGIAESELFGHVKGAFTDARTDRIGCFELADEGTLFLDEIANMPVKLQAKLLRVLQTGEVQTVGSSRLSLRERARAVGDQRGPARRRSRAGRFREDLLYRLNTVVIHLPPLRDRREDIEPLAAHYLARYAERYRKPLDGFDRAARQALVAHLWPGNVRELAHAIERAVLMATGPPRDYRGRSRTARPARGRPAEELTARAGREAFHRKGARPPRRRRAACRRAARHEPQRAVPAAPALWRPRIAARLARPVRTGRCTAASSSRCCGSAFSAGLPAGLAVLYLTWTRPTRPRFAGR